MCLHVGSQIGAISKRLAAVGTAERLFASVRSHVTLQKPWPGESLTTHITLVIKSVGQDVHSQSWHTDIHFVASWTLFGQL